ncbi:MAG: hypothetical protein IT419_04800 [Planctomycetes bacterium]|nr:hypothetical protein [Planctomycetota bacterium]
MATTETGHQANRTYRDRDGDFHLNGAKLYLDEDGNYLDADGFNDPDLTLNSTNEININIGGVSILALDDAAISGNAGASATAGKPCFIETQDGGAAATNANGTAGGALSIKTGDGTIPNGSGTTGGAGGAVTITGGTGAAGGATGTGGAGGSLVLAAGVGGATSGAGTGGAGGDIVLTPAAGGATSGGTAGADGHVKFGAAASKLAAGTGNPAFGTGKGFTGAANITNCAAWFIVKDSAGAKFGIPAWAFS